VRAHHERWDGAGYPDGLSGEAIPLEARIIAVCDSYDAMTSGISHESRLSHGEALQELELGAGSQFDPAVIEAFMRVQSRAPGAQSPAG
jgi:HD-GYP domain-containing protein (c-di-GMP phosphodiesterase class II)